MISGLIPRVIISLIKVFTVLHSLRARISAPPALALVASATFERKTPKCTTKINTTTCSRRKTYRGRTPKPGCKCQTWAMRAECMVVDLKVKRRKERKCWQSETASTSSYQSSTTRTCNILVRERSSEKSKSSPTSRKSWPSSNQEYAVCAARCMPRVSRTRPVMLPLSTSSQGHRGLRCNRGESTSIIRCLKRRDSISFRKRRTHLPAKWIITIEVQARTSRPQFRTTKWYSLPKPFSKTLTSEAWISRDLRTKVWPVPMQNTWPCSQSRPRTDQLEKTIKPIDHKKDCSQVCRKTCDRSLRTPNRNWYATSVSCRQTSKTKSKTVSLNWSRNSASKVPAPSTYHTSFCIKSIRSSWS